MTNTTINGGDEEVQLAEKLRELDELLPDVSREKSGAQNDKFEPNQNTENHAGSPLNQRSNRGSDTGCPVKGYSPYQTTPFPHLPRTHLFNVIRLGPAHTTNPNQAANKNTKPSAWRRLTDLRKFTLAVRAAGALHGLTFNLNLSKSRRAAVVRSDDPLRLITKYLNRELKKAELTATPYALTLEISPQGRLHIHGVVLPYPGTTEPLKGALMAAGGKLPGRTASRQVQLKQIDDADGWVGYCLKDTKKTAPVIKGTRTTFVSTPMSRIAKDFMLNG